MISEFRKDVPLIVCGGRGGGRRRRCRRTRSVLCFSSPTRTGVEQGLSAGASGGASLASRRFPDLIERQLHNLVVRPRSKPSLYRRATRRTRGRRSARMPGGPAGYDPVPPHRQGMNGGGGGMGPGRPGDAPFHRQPRSAPTEGCLGAEGPGGRPLCLLGDVGAR